MPRRSLVDVHQRAAALAFIRAGGIDRGQRSGHWVIKMPNGKRVSLPTGILRTGLLRAQIRVAGLAEEEFLELL
jgi:hypothetical protein